MLLIEHRINTASIYNLLWKVSYRYLWDNMLIMTKKLSITKNFPLKIFPSVPVSCTVMLVLVSAITSPCHFCRAIRYQQSYDCRSGLPQARHPPLSGNPDVDAPLQGSPNIMHWYQICSLKSRLPAICRSGHRIFC